MRDSKEKSAKTVPNRKWFSKRGYHSWQIASQTRFSRKLVRELSRKIWPLEPFVPNALFLTVESIMALFSTTRKDHICYGTIFPVRLVSGNKAKRLYRLYSPPPFGSNS